ncbi:TPA: phage tailspike protein [Klebsiella aerogenes]
MPEQSYNVVVSQPSQLFTLSRSLKANNAGKIYIGKIDTDPVNPENQIQVYIDPENGLEPIPVAQPITINAGGYPVYNGQIAKFVTVEGHSMAVYDSNNVQQFYYPNVLKYDPDQLRQELGTDIGADLVGAAPEGTVQDFIDIQNDKNKYITPQLFGAKGDYNPTTDTGTDDTAAFRQAIAVAVTLGRRKVVVPAGFNYLITNNLNLGGVGYIGSDGVALVGENWVNTNLYFRAPDNNTACIEILGGSGIHTGRYISGLTIQPTIGTRYTGVGYRIAGGCFIKNGLCLIRQFAVNLHLLNNRQAGVFTEQNVFRDMRIHRGLVNILMETNGGDNSFHANDFSMCQLQVKTSVDGGDGNTTPGVGLELRGVTAPVYWYNSFFNVHMFGGAGAIGIKLTNANTDGIVGNVTAEGALILKSTDSTSSFEVRGGFYSIGSVTFDVPGEPTARSSVFVFENRLSNTSNFTSPRMTGMSPRQLPLYLADRTDNGGYPAVFRATGTNIDGMCYASAGTAGSNHFFGYTPPGGNLQSFVPGVAIGYDGSSIASYSTTFFISNASTGLQLTSAFFGPRTDNNIDFGSGAFRPKQYWGVNSSIATSDADHKTEPRLIYDAEVDAFYEIGQLPWVWQWLLKYQAEGDGARLHSGPTVQAAIAVMEKHGLDWRNYSAFCFNQWDAQDEVVETWDDIYETIPKARALYDESGACIQEEIPEHKVLVTPAGSRVVSEAVEAGQVYSFRKEELILWVLRATIEKQKNIESRLAALESMR